MTLIKEGEEFVTAAGNKYPIMLNDQFYKVLLSLEDYERDVITMIQKMLASSFVPDFIVPIGRGGFLPYAFAERVLEARGHSPDMYPIITDSYTGTGERTDDIKIYLAKEAIEAIQGQRPDARHGNKVRHERLLILDDVDDQLLTADAVLERFRKDLPYCNIERAVVYRKPYAARRRDVKRALPTIDFKVEKIYGEDKRCWILFPTENPEYKALKNWAEDFKEQYRHPENITLTPESAIRAFMDLKMRLNA